MSLSNVKIYQQLMIKIIDPQRLGKRKICFPYQRARTYCIPKVNKLNMIGPLQFLLNTAIPFYFLQTKSDGYICLDVWIAVASCKYTYSFITANNEKNSKPLRVSNKELFSSLKTFKHIFSFFNLSSFNINYHAYTMDYLLIQIHFSSYTQFSLRYFKCIGIFYKPLPLPAIKTAEILVTIYLLEQQTDYSYIK